MAKKTLKLERGTIYQKQENGTFYFRFQVNGERKAVSLKTKSFKEAQEKAEEMLPVITAPSLNVIAAHVSHANFGARKKKMSLSKAWEIYEAHPDRAMPSTVSEKRAYEITWNDFQKFIKRDVNVNDVTVELAMKYADHLRSQKIAVATHNRKIGHLRKVFSVMGDYYDGENPFMTPALKRKNREEQDNHVRRLAFTKDQELDILRVLDDDKYIVLNKPEIRVLYSLGMFTGQRMKDCALLQWSKVSFARKRIWVKQYKTSKEVSIPISTRLMKVLKEAEQWKQNEYVIPAVAARYKKKDKRGKNTGAALLNNDIMRVIKWIGLKPSVTIPEREKAVTVYGFHSLRHSFASHCAEAGVA